ncbi:MAG: DUF2924 domain-containing protein [Phycisphaerales bacterium]|nr:DUF2924 domain-containing protein [Phycisphaerales bacterium]
MAMNVGKELADLREMSVRELREKYESVFGEPTRAGNKDWLFKRIAWRIQALAEGDLSERALRRAEFLARDADLRTTAPRTPVANAGNGVNVAVGGNGGGEPGPAPAVLDERVPPPGTVLTRRYRGQAYHVRVRHDGFEYDGQHFRSLSAIAKIITGSHWNGLLFFRIAKRRTTDSTAHSATSRPRSGGVAGVAERRACRSRAGCGR